MRNSKVIRDFSTERYSDPELSVYVFRFAGAGYDPLRNWSDEISSFVL